MPKKSKKSNFGNFGKVALPAADPDCLEGGRGEIFSGPTTLCPRIIREPTQIFFTYQSLRNFSPKGPPQEITAQQLLFEWSYFRISSTDSKVRTTPYR